MFEIKSPDYRFVNVNVRHSHNTGPVTLAEIDMSYDFKSKWDLMVLMLQEWQEQKKLIEANPAVKASWEQFQQMVQLAKEGQ